MKPLLLIVSPFVYLCRLLVNVSLPFCPSVPDVPYLSFCIHVRQIAGVYLLWLRRHLSVSAIPRTSIFIFLSVHDILIIIHIFFNIVVAKHTG